MREWSGWIQHDGRLGPIGGLFFEAIVEGALGGLSGRGTFWVVSDVISFDELAWDWRNWGELRDKNGPIDGPLCCRIRSYRYRIPKGAALLEEIVRDPLRIVEDAK